MDAIIPEATALSSGRPADTFDRSTQRVYHTVLLQLWKMQTSFYSMIQENVLDVLTTKPCFLAQ